MSVNSEIRAHLQAGVGSRQVRINPRSEVHTKGSPDGCDTAGWRFVGLVNDVLKRIDTERKAMAS